MSSDPYAPHLVKTPEWTCRACGREWPCEPARTEALKEFSRYTLALSTLMNQYAFQAQMDLGDTVEPAELWHRFLGWIGGAAS